MFSTGDDPAARLRHELHTPLTSILAYTRLLRDDLAGAPAADALTEGVACLDAIDRNAVRLQRYVDGVVLPLAATDPADAAGTGRTTWARRTWSRCSVTPSTWRGGSRSPVRSASTRTRRRRSRVAVDDLVCRHLVGHLVLWLATAAPSRAHIEIALRADPVPAIDARIIAHGELTAPQPRLSDPQKPAETRGPADLRVASAVASLCGGEVRLDETSFRLTLPASVLATVSRRSP